MRTLTLFAALLSTAFVSAQEIKPLFETALKHRKAYGWLEDLTAIGPRLSGSPESFMAADWAVEELRKAGADTVWKQEVPDVPRWERGAPETLEVIPGSGRAEALRICSLGGSVATNGSLEAGVVRFGSFDEMKKAGRKAVEGKVVFFDVPMDQSLLSTGHAYGLAVNYRWAGALEASKLGAVGVLIRSVTTRFDDEPHTGSMTYDGAEHQIPAAALGYLSADKLTRYLLERPNLSIRWTQNCRTLPDTLGYNVIAEWRGSTYPDRYFVVGGHLDSWDLAQGAHDDGAGCVQSMEVPWLLAQVGYRPAHTLRAVLFINEENGLRGGRFYAEQAAARGEVHRFALESDGGGSTPQGFSFQTSEEVYTRLKKELKEQFEPFGLYSWGLGGSGADISPLVGEQTLLCGLRVDGQAYFDFHHASTDRLENVHPRRLELGAAAMAALVMWLDSHPELLP